MGATSSDRYHVVHVPVIAIEKCATVAAPATVASIDERSVDVLNCNLTQSSPPHICRLDVLHLRRSRVLRSPLLQVGQPLALLHLAVLTGVLGPLAFHIVATPVVCSVRQKAFTPTLVVASTARSLPSISACIAVPSLGAVVLAGKIDPAVSALLHSYDPLLRFALAPCSSSRPISFEAALRAVFRLVLVLAEGQLFVAHPATYDTTLCFRCLPRFHASPSSFQGASTALLWTLPILTNGKRCTARSAHPVLHQSIPFRIARLPVL